MKLEPFVLVACCDEANCSLVGFSLVSEPQNSNCPFRPSNWPFLHSKNTTFKGGMSKLTREILQNWVKRQRTNGSIFMHVGGGGLPGEGASGQEGSCGELGGGGCKLLLFSGPKFRPSECMRLHEHLAV